MRGEQRAVRLGERGDAPDLGDPAGVGEVGLSDRDSGGEDREELGPRVQALTGRDRNGRDVDDLAQPVPELGQDGLLHEQRTVGLEHRQQAARIGDTDAAVEVDRDVVVGADRLAHVGHPLYDAVEFGRTGQPAESPARVHLQGRQTAVDLRPCRIRDLGGLVAADPSVDPDPVTHRPTEEGVHRDVQRLAQDVPQGLVQPGDGARQDRSAAIEAALGQHLPVRLDAARVLPDQQRSELVHGRPHHVGAALDHGLAPPDDARVGLDAAEQPARGDGERVHCRDLHSDSLVSSSARTSERSSTDLSSRARVASTARAGSPSRIASTTAR